MSTGRVYHQDYIARIRYSNALPPPPNPPKLLELPNTGLGQYVTAGFASRLARDQPLNIEADAELGMPIDLVGIPGVFDGDEKAIQAPSNPPQPHPHDRDLLRPLNQMGKPKGMSAGVSFLRRTEYMTAQGASTQFQSSTATNMVKSRTPKKRRGLDKEDPINIVKNIQKGFDIAYPKEAYRGPDTADSIRGAEASQAERDAWARPQHPSDPNLKVLDSYPVIPDLAAFPPSAGQGFVVTKFITNPLPASDTYPQKLDAGIFRIMAMTPEGRAQYNQWKEGNREGKRRQAPPPLCDYEYFLPVSDDAPKSIKRKFSLVDSERDDPSLYTDEDAESGSRNFKYKHIRVYEAFQASGVSGAGWEDTTGQTEALALALHDPETEVGETRLQKAAYYYPVSYRWSVRPRVKKRPGVEEDRIDYLSLTVGEGAVQADGDGDGAVQENEDEDE